MDGFHKVEKAVGPNPNDLSVKHGHMDIRTHRNNVMEPIGDAAYNEENMLQDRIIRILSYTQLPTDVIFLYFNNQYTDDPPSCSLFEDDEPTQQSHVKDEQGMSRGLYNMFPTIVKSKIVDQPVNSYHIQDIVTRVYLPSEEFAEVVVLRSHKTLWKRIWKWFKRKASCS